MAARTSVPDVSRCLDGEHVLLSWEDILAAIITHDKPPSQRQKDFFDTHAALLAGSTIPAFAKPNATAKAAFDNAVAPLNITSEQKQKDLEKIKADALWLSDTFKLDEVEALRMVLLEWQNRPEFRLNAGFADAELASLRDALSTEHVQALDLMAGGQLSRDEDHFETEHARRARILQIYYRSYSAMLAVARECHQLSLDDLDGASREDPKIMWSEPFETSVPTNLTTLVTESIESVRQILSSAEQQQGWLDIDAASLLQVDYEHGTFILQATAIILQLLTLRVFYSKTPVTADILTPWLDFLADYDYFSQFQSQVPAHAEAIKQIQSSASYVTLSLLNVGHAMRIVETYGTGEAQSESVGQYYFLEVDRIEDLNRYMQQAAASVNPYASQMVFVWALLFSQIRVKGVQQVERTTGRLHDRLQATDGTGRRNSTSSLGSVPESLFDRISSKISFMEGAEDPLDYMLQSAIRGSNVLDGIGLLATNAKSSSSVLSSCQLELLQMSITAARHALAYTPDIFEAQLAILQQDQSQPESGPFKPVEHFIQDDFLMEHFFEVTASRFPYESLPFLRLLKFMARANDPSLFKKDTGHHYVTMALDNIDTYTQEATGAFAHYHTTDEIENANLVALDDAVGLLDHRPKRMLSYHGSTPTEKNLIPANTTGVVISESMPPIIQWQHKYSGFGLLGAWLELHVQGELASIVSPFESPDNVVAAVLGLLSALLESTYSNAIREHELDEGRERCQGILDAISSELETGRDIVDYAFDLVEQQLVSTRRFSPASGCELLTAGLDLIEVLCRIRPQQTWALLVRSSALAAYGAKRSLFSVISSVEVPLQSFSLFESCARLLSTTIDLVLTISSGRYDTKGRKPRSIPSQRPLATAVLGLTETMFAAFEALPGWTFTQPAQKKAILHRLSSGFSDLLYYTFGTGESHDKDSSVTGCLRPAADFLLGALSATGVQSLGSGPLALNLVTTLLGHAPGIFIINEDTHLHALVRLARTHLGCSRLSDRALKKVNGGLISLLPVFIRIPILYPSVLRLCLALECDILDAYKPDPAPHILGHLGSLSSLSFLDSLNTCNARAYEEAHIVWRLISRLISAEQQWTAIVIITGSPPGRQPKEGEPARIKTRGKPLFEQALDKLMQVESLNSAVAVAILHMITEAQQSWPSVTDMINAKPDLFQTLIKQVEWRNSYSDSDLAQALHYEFAAGVTELSVIWMHTLMSQRDEKKFATFIPLLRWLTKNAINVEAYNSSLHANLKKNFASKYGGLEVSFFKRTGVLRIPYGNDYFYDLNFADKILDYDAHWSQGRESYRAEVERANINLSVVDAELKLIQSFEYLCSEHGVFFARHRDVRVVMAHIVDNCLAANTRATPSEAIFDSLYQTRAEISLMLLGPLVTAGAHGSDFSSLLRRAYETSRYRNGSYDLAIVNDDLVYWRSMLNVLRLTMQFHARKAKGIKKSDIGNLDSIIGMYCEIAAKVIGEGLRSVVTTLQDTAQNSKGQPSTDDAIDAGDVTLLLNILQTMLRLPSLPHFVNQLSEALISTGVPQTCLLLYSWSHLLHETPIYGVLASQLLVCVSQLPPMAEELAVEGVFNRLLISKMSTRIQNLPNGVGHLERRPNGLQLYTIWTEGLVRIALSLLDSIGGGVAVEVAGFLNQFPQQLVRASLSFSSSPTRAEGAEGISLGAASELANLSLLSYILERLRLAGASSGVDPTAIMPLAGFDEVKKSIVNDINDVLGQEVRFRLKREVPTTETEAFWAKERPSKESKVTVLDQMICRELQHAKRCLGGDADD
jgi:nuclear pore complex protein Nup188